MSAAQGSGVECGGWALVTGGARRVGRAIAEALAGRGMSVVVHYGRSRDDAAAVVESLRARGAGAAAVSVDLAQAGAGEEVVAKAREAAGGPLRLLVNNASEFPAGDLWGMSAADLHRNVQVNAMTPFEAGRAFARQAREAGSGIVNLLDCRVAGFDAGHAAYSLSKNMLRDLTWAMAAAFAPTVRVNAVAPGVILAPAGEADPEAYLRRMARGNPLGAWGGVEDVADAVLYLAGARFVTGQVVYVDGGWHMRGGGHGEASGAV